MSVHKFFLVKPSDDGEEPACREYRDAELPVGGRKREVDPDDVRAELGQRVVAAASVGVAGLPQVNAAPSHRSGYPRGLYAVDGMDQIFYVDGEGQIFWVSDMDSLNKIGLTVSTLNSNDGPRLLGIGQLGPGTAANYKSSQRQIRGQ